ncbi:MAG: ATP-binding protein [Planctomycetota bacterium]
MTQYAIVCSCTVPQGDPGLLSQAAAHMADRGYGLLQMQDLCAGLRDRSIDWQTLAAAGPVPVVAACQQRALTALLHGIPEAGRCIGCKGTPLTMLGERCELVPPARVFASDESGSDGCECDSGCCDTGCECDSGCCTETTATSTSSCACAEASADKQGAEAWFPTLDMERCTHCRQCLDFCLFNVYELVGKKVAVIAPENCKPDCPACARVCPQQAIIFPKHPQSPIDGGEPATEAPTKELKELLTGDLRATLAKRQPPSRFRRRFSLNQDQERAEAERHAHLMDLASAAGLSDEIDQLVKDQTREGGVRHDPNQ